MSEISPQQKKDHQRKKKNEREKGREKRRKDWKAKEVKPHMKKLQVSKGEKKKKMMEFTSYWERFYQKKERRSHFPIVENPMCGLSHTHILFAFALPSIPWLFPVLPPFTTPFSINNDYLPHKLSRIFLCFYNIQGVA
jgi:hypothetical protein